MKRFHHGGRVGDCLYALYTVKALSDGGAKVDLSSFHTPGWGEFLAKSLLPLIAYQDYVYSAGYIEVPYHELVEWRAHRLLPDFLNSYDYDLWQAENDHNPEKFPEWHGKSWPGNCHIAKRYAVHFGVEWDPDAVWLTAPSGLDVDVVFHMPMRRMVRPAMSWLHILNRLQELGYKVVILSGNDDYGEWGEYVKSIPRIVPSSFLHTAQYINSSRLFLGGASSCNVIAEGLKKNRIVELAEGCDDTYPYGETGQCINGVSDLDVITRSLKVLEYG